MDFLDCDRQYERGWRALHFRNSFLNLALFPAAGGHLGWCVYQVAVAEKAEIAQSVEREVWPLIEQGRIKPIVDSVFPLEKAAEAQAKMAGSSHIGKILLTP